MTDLTTLTEAELDLETSLRWREYQNYVFYLTATTVSAQEDIFLDVTEAGSIKVVVTPRYNSDLTQAYLSAQAFVKEFSYGVEFTWRLILDENDSSRTYEPFYRNYLQAAITAYRAYVEVLREHQRRAAIRRAEALALIEIEVTTPVEYI